MRAAGNKPGYTFVLRNENTGKTMEGVTIWLPSSTTIVKQTLAAPQLIGWAYRTTRDNISGLVSSAIDVRLERPDDIIDILTDADMLEEWLKDNRARPDDVRDERADEGHERHAVFERLANAGLQDDESDLRLAAKLSDSNDGWEAGIGQWWLDRQPHVLASEKVLPCPQHGYCGTGDIVWQNVLDLVGVTVTDLKTRKADAVAYDSDFYQIDSYKTAWNLLYPSRQAVRSTALIVRADGSYIEEENHLPDGSFLKLKEVWDLNQRLKLARKGVVE